MCDACCTGAMLPHVTETDCNSEALNPINPKPLKPIIVASIFFSIIPNTTPIYNWICNNAQICGYLIASFEHVQSMRLGVHTFAIYKLPLGSVGGRTGQRRSSSGLQYALQIRRGHPSNSPLGLYHRHLLCCGLTGFSQGGAPSH